MYYLYLFSQIIPMILRSVIVEYLVMQNMKMHANSVFPNKNSERVISAMSSRRYPSITELPSRAYTSSAPVASPTSRRPRLPISSINSWMLMRTSETLCSLANVWKSARVHVISGITISVFGFLSNSG